jgi:hypothetical protein
LLLEAICFGDIHFIFGLLANLLLVVVAVVVGGFSNATYTMVWRIWGISMAWRRDFGRPGEAQTLCLHWFGWLGKVWRGSNVTYTMVWRTLGGPERLPRYVYSGFYGLET